MGSNVYLKPEEMADWIAAESGMKVDALTVKKIALEGNLINEDGKVGLYEMIAYMAMFVK